MVGDHLLCVAPPSSLAAHGLLSPAGSPYGMNSSEYEMSFPDSTAVPFLWLSGSDFQMQGDTNCLHKK